MPKMNCTTRVRQTIMSNGVTRQTSEEETERMFQDREQHLAGRPYPREVSYDFLSDATYIYLINPADFPQGKCHTVPIANGVLCDFYEGKPVGLEILWVTDHIEKYLQAHATETPTKEYNTLGVEDPNYQLVDDDEDPEA